MLKVDDLKKQIKSAFSEYIPLALETCFKNSSPIRSEISDRMAENFAKQFDEMVSDPLAESLANAIDYYIRNADITGFIITNGSSTTHTVTINPPPTPITGGKIPNTLGIN